MSSDKEKFIQIIIKKLGIDKENNPDEIKFNNMDTDREYQIKLAKKLWNDKISIEDKFWYPEDYYYIEDFMLEKEGFKKIGEINFNNSKEDNFFQKEGDYFKDFKFYLNEIDNKLLLSVYYKIYKDKYSSFSNNFIGIFDLRDVIG